MRGGTCRTHGRDGNTYKIVMRKPEGKRPHGKTRRMLEHDIRMDLREVGSEGVEWLHLAQDRDQWRAVVNTVVNFLVP
jgi:hypothetical protein